MTINRFQKIAKETSVTFWSATYKYLSPEEQKYLQITPAANRNLNIRLMHALGKTLLTENQLSRLQMPSIEEIETKELELNS